ncbi:hypothetical protein WT14_26965 [Burkholderia stagnalis]|nr:hypothetical protein WT07_03020 [Burkholderia stagnalis]KVN56498.1 hypothetical protein WT14_26965 [Burkholderia stagnalis]KWD93106.1 hypothetical protein WT47_32575 [Burkholderia stagnalis]KWE22249.1 hypothetical protein WT48_06595 [Burkholderia stagnalis]KWO86596.1 hypothetical protein WU00_26925 [Burkholderia stagnalis]
MIGSKNGTRRAMRTPPITRRTSRCGIDTHGENIFAGRCSEQAAWRRRHDPGARVDYRRELRLSDPRGSRSLAKAATFLREHL